jgi:hypothetical protein
MRRLILSLAVTTVVGTGLAAALPAPAQAEWGSGYYDHNDWRERARREHEWRERQAWAWRHHLWHEWHEHHFDH